MAHAFQSAAAGKRNYATSQLRQRNEKLQRAAHIAPVCKGDAGSEEIAISPRAMTAAEYVADGDQVGVQINAGREPHLLVRDTLNEGEFGTVAIYDVKVEQEARSGLCEFDLHVGAVLVKPDALVYWK